MKNPLHNSTKYALLLGLLLTIFRISFAQSDNVRLDSTYAYSFTSKTDSVFESKNVCSYSSFSNSTQCYNFSTCISSNWEGQTRSWIPFFKTEFRSEENGTKRITNSYSWNTKRNIWYPQRRVFNMETDRIRETDVFKWDTLSQIWIHLDLYRRNFDQRGNQFFFERKTYDQELKTWSGFKKEEEYDESDRRISFSQADWDHDANEWSPNLRYTQTYTPFGNIQQKINYTWSSEDREWNLETTENYEYSADNKLLQIVTVNGVYKTISDFTYNDQGQEIYWQRSYQQHPDIPPIVEEKRERSYDAQGNEILYMHYRWNPTSNEWDIHTKTERVYNAQSKLTLQRRYSRDWQLLQLYLQEEFSYTYDFNGNIETDERFRYYSTGGISSGVKVQFTYDSEDRFILRIESKWDIPKQDWVFNRRTENPYDSQGNVKFYAWYNWDNQEEKWVGLGITGFDYTSEGYQSRRYVGFWRHQQEDWFITSSQSYIYGPCTKENTILPREKGLLIYPNPVSQSELYIESELERPFTYEVLDLKGQRVLYGEMNSLVNSLSVKNLRAGTYIIYCRSGKQVEIKKFLVSNS